MKYSQAQVEKILLEHDWMTQHPSITLSELTSRNSELLEVMLTDADTYNQAAIAVYGNEEKAA